MAAVCRCNVLLQIVAYCVATLSDKMSGNAGTIGPIFAVRELKATCKRTQQLPTLLGQQCRSCCLRVGSGVQMDETAPNNIGICSASWEGYNP